MTDLQGRRGGNPPDEFKFRKGTTGNPRGRPKGRKNTKTMFARELAEQIVIQQGSSRKKVGERLGNMSK